MTEHERFMREALVEAGAAGAAGQLPIGAVLVLEGEILEQESLDLIGRYDRRLLGYIQG